MPARSASATRIFSFSAIASLLILGAVLKTIGVDGLLTALILAAVEITFSFENAIINAKILKTLSAKWQTIFLTAGIIVAIFGMRVIFPILVVVVTAHLSWSETVRLALHQPTEYAHHLEIAHPLIAAFGGGFLLMLALHFFLDDEREVLWLQRIERPLQRITTWWGAPAIAVSVIGGLAVLPANTHGEETIVAGAIGAVTYGLIQVFVGLLSRLQRQPNQKGQVALQTGWAAVMTLFYLEIIDASFSFDGVIGAFAISSNVVLIAAGLGIGAFWVRSLTVFMVRRGTLEQYKYLEHGAHYTVFILAIILLASVIWNISNLIPGLAGIGIIAASVLASIIDSPKKQRRH